MEEEKKKEPELPKVYTLKDVIDFEKADAYSSFGKMILSQKNTAEKYGFGTSTRKAQEKVYQSKALVKSQFIGKTSPGPGAPYYYEEAKNKYTYDIPPTWSFGTEKRNTLGIKVSKRTGLDKEMEPFMKAYFETDVDGADKKRKKRNRRVKFGAASRFKSSNKGGKNPPGPKYDPPFRENFKNTEKFSFGYRRDIPGYSAITPLISTNPGVGPGTHFKTARRNKETGKPCKPLKLPFTSKQRKFPHYSVPKQTRFRRGRREPSGETYENYRSIGKQQRSKMRTESKVNFTKARREVKTGMFKDMMSTKPTRVRINHPKF